MILTGPFKRYLDQDLLKDKYNELRKLYWAYKHDIDYSSDCISPFNKGKCLCDYKLRLWLCWVNRNIILNLGLDSEITTHVKLRIAASMLNKVDSLTAFENVQIFTNLKDNVNSEIWTLTNEELPF